MNTLVITVDDNTLHNLEQKAHAAGKSSAQIAADLVEDVFGTTVNGGFHQSEVDTKKQKASVTTRRSVKFFEAK